MSVLWPIELSPETVKNKISNMSLYREHVHLLKSWKRGRPRWPLGGPLGTKFRSKNFKYLSRIAYLAFTHKTTKIIISSYFRKIHTSTFINFQALGIKVLRFLDPPRYPPLGSLFGNFLTLVETSPNKKQVFVGLNWPERSLPLYSSRPLSL